MLARDRHSHWWVYHKAFLAFLDIECIWIDWECTWSFSNLTLKHNDAESRTHDHGDCVTHSPITEKRRWWLRILIFLWQFPHSSHSEGTSCEQSKQQ